MTWAKIDTAFHRNPKVRMAGREARDVFLFVVLTNAEKGADGELNAMILDPAYLADSLQCTVAEAELGVKRCETFHLLHVTGDIVAICGWDDEWKVTRSTDRVRKHRAKQKQALDAGETLRNVSSVSCNGETPKKERKKEEKEREGARKRASKIPSDWQPTEAHVNLAATGRLDVLAEADKFRDHAKATGRTLVSWDAGFRNWLRKGAEFRRPSATTSAPRHPRRDRELT